MTVTHTVHPTPLTWLLMTSLSFSNWRHRRFGTIDVIEAESQVVPNILTERDFQGRFKNWQKCWDRYECGKGDYFRGPDSSSSPGKYGSKWYNCFLSVLLRIQTEYIQRARIAHSSLDLSRCVKLLITKKKRR
jgi:hypothetical protein